MRESATAVKNLRIHNIAGVVRAVDFLQPRHQELHCILLPDAGERHVELAMRENWPGQVDSHALEGLALGLVDGHSKCRPHGELAAAEGEGPVLLREAHLPAAAIADGRQVLECRKYKVWSTLQGTA